MANNYFLGNAPTIATSTKNTLFQYKLQYSREESAAILSISLRTLDRLVAEEKLPVRRIGRRVLITREAVERFTLLGSKDAGAQ